MSAATTAMVAVAAAFLLAVLPLATLAEDQTGFTRQSLQLTNAPASSSPAPSRLFCSAQCQRQPATVCGAFVYGQDGVCHLYSRDGLCEGPATLPDNGEAASDRWVRSTCPGERRHGRGAPGMGGVMVAHTKMLVAGA